MGTFREEIRQSVTQQQKFHTNDVKSDRNPVIKRWLDNRVLNFFSYCLQMTDERKKDTKVKCKCNESIIKQSTFVEHILLYKKHLSFAGACSQMNTTLHQNRPGEMQNWKNLHLEPHHNYWIYYVNIDLCHQYGISVADHRRSSSQNAFSARRNSCFIWLEWTLLISL